MTRPVFLAAFAAATMSTISGARAAEPHELPSVMIISKSGNRNEVRYAAYIDDRCAPATKAPMHPYWLMRERGPEITEPLSSSERRVLGVASQEVSGDAIRFVVSGVPSRTFVAHVRRGADGVCASWVDTMIAGAQAWLTGIYIKQYLFGVDYVQLTGLTSDGKTV